MFPLISLLVLFYLLFAQLRMINRRPILVIVRTIIFFPLFIWFSRGYMQSIPIAIIDSEKWMVPAKPESFGGLLLRRHFSFTTFTGATFLRSVIMALGVVGSIVPLVIGIVFQKHTISSLPLVSGQNFRLFTEILTRYLFTLQHDDYSFRSANVSEAYK